MGYRTRAFGTRRVELDEHYYVEIAPLTKGEDDEAKRALLGGAAIEGTIKEAQSQQIKTRFFQKEYTDQVLLCAIKAWNLDDDEGAILPITLENIQALRDDHSDKIMAVTRGISAPLEDTGKLQD